jgi:hypothetical protein
LIYSRISITQGVRLPWEGPGPTGKVLVSQRPRVAPDGPMGEKDQPVCPEVEYVLETAQVWSQVDLIVTV